MKNIKKIITILLITFLLFGCFKKQDKEDNTAKDGLFYINEIKNYKVKEKNINNTIDNKEFDEYLDNIFIKSVTDSYLYMHSNIRDYKKLGISKPEVKWGDLEYSDEADSLEYIEELEKLRKFDYNSLSYRQQFDYDLYEYSLLETIASAFYEKYDLLYSSGTDILSGLVVTLDEFKLYDEESIQDYLILLKDVDKYLDDSLAYTKAQADNGLYLSNTSIEYNIDYIDGFVSKIDDNSLIVSFNNRLSNLDFIDSNTKQKYINESSKIVKEEVIPAFNKVKEKLLEYVDKGSDEDLALCNIDKNYAELTFMLNTSMNISIDDLFDLVQDAMDDLTAGFYSALYDTDAIEEFDIISNSNKYGAFGLEDKETLDYLKDNLKKKFPEINDIEYEVSRLDATSASDNTVAYYLSPPLDDLKHNVIRTNPNAMGEDIVYDYCVLAHEGFPGHLYQNLYFQKTNPNRFRETQEFIGYTEGYACYVETEALEFSGIKNINTVNIYRYLYMADYLVDSIVDMGVNYYGWNIKEIERYLKNEGLNEEAASYMYDSAINRPGILDRYGAGYAVFHSLQENAKNKLGDKYNDVEFNEMLLKNGPLPFCILSGALDVYIESKTK